jgi:hypothetical protein
MCGLSAFHCAYRTVCSVSFDTRRQRRRSRATGAGKAKRPERCVACCTAFCGTFQFTFFGEPGSISKVRRQERESLERMFGSRRRGFDLRRSRVVANHARLRVLQFRLKTTLAARACHGPLPSLCGESHASDITLSCECAREHNACVLSVANRGFPPSTARSARPDAPAHRSP